MHSLINISILGHGPVKLAIGDVKPAAGTTTMSTNGVLNALKNGKW